MILSLGRVQVIIYQRPGLRRPRFLEEFSGLDRPSLGTASARARVWIRRPGALRLPPGARLEGFWPERALRHYVKGSGHFWISGKSLIAVDFYSGRLTLSLADAPDPPAEETARNALKWMIIKTAERAGYFYMHAGAVRLGGAQILLPGNSGSGKSSFLIRLRRAGGEILNDDVVLWDSRSQQYLSLPLAIHVKGDFKKRFRVPVSRRWIWPVPESPVREPVKTVLFPCVYQSSHSRVTPLTEREALNRLDTIYQKETDWNAYPEPADMRRRAYSRLLKKAEAFAFYAGRNEQEVERTLRGFLRARRCVQAGGK